MSQQIYLPLGDKYPIPHEFEADTMQVPRGQYSVLSELEKGNLTSAQAIILLVLNHGSTWNSGATWSMSGPYLSKILGAGMSRRYVRDTLANLLDKGWIETIDEDNPSGNRYRIRHHLCHPDDVPVNKDGKPLKFAVPRGPGGPLERCFDGDISWKAALAWISLKLRSNWKAHEDTAGQTEKAKLTDLARKCGISLSIFHKLITELTEQGLLERLSNQRQPAIFQLYPKPFPRPVQSAPPRRAEQIYGKPIETDGEYYYSHNNQYRCNRETGEIEQRQRGGVWKRVSEYHKYQVMPKVIRRDFERCLEVKRAVESSLSS